MKKNVSGQKIGAQMISASDGSAFTGAVTVYVTGDAGTQAAGSEGSGACTHEGQGYHTYAPAQAETNYDLIAFTFTGSGAVPATVQVFTTFPQTGDSYARLGAPAGASVSADILAIDNLVDDLEGRVIGTIAAGTHNPQSGDAYARLGAPSGASVSADILAIDNLVDDLEGRVIGTIAAGTHNPQSGDAFARLGAPAGASVSADIADVESKVDDLEGRVIGTIAAGTHVAQTGDAYAVVNHVTYGNSALNTKLGTPAGASVSADILTIDNLVDDLEGRVIGTIAAGTHVAQSGDSFARLGAPAGASVSADLLVIDNLVDDLEGRVIGTIAAGTHTAQTGDAYAIVNSGTHGNAALKTLLDAIDDYVDSEVAALVTELAKVPKSDSNVTWNATALASINAEIVDALGTDALAELSAGAPSATPTIKAALMFLYMALRNKVDQTSSLTEVHNNAGTVIASAAVSDDGTTFTKAQYGAP